MAQTLISFLLMKRITQNPKPAFSNLFHLSRYLSLKPYSTSSLPDPPKPSSLSARMSFVFDQIDAIERERAQKDETLQRIRAWRQSKNTVQHQLQNPQTISSENPEILSSQNEGLESRFADNGDSSLKLTDINSVELKKKTEVEVVHPWPEWIELMERLVQQNYFDHRRKDEDKMVRDLGFDEHGIGSDDDFGIDFKDFKTVQTACVNFGKDRFDIFRSLSRKDIQVLVGYGCPSADKKVVFSAKLLRKHVHLDEGDVCSNCSLRSSCERAYLITNKEDEARTIDVMRVLLTYGFDPINGSVVNKSLLKQKSIRTVVRKLLHEVVKLSAVPIDPNLPPPVIKKPPPKVKQPPPTPKRRVGRDDVEMKKGDWLCPKCDFMNFAKNTVCLQCDAKRPKRQLLPGEWECPECNFLNYRRNMACFHCDCKRPPDEFIENKMEEKQHGHKTRLEKVTSRPEVSNAWNFDFDDNESDGADVAAFEYADPEAMNEDSPLGARAQGGNFRVLDEDLNRTSRIPRVHEREFSDSSHNRPGMGFDDFDDEDDVDSYELDTENNSPAWKDSRNNLSRTEISESEDVEDFDDNFSRPRKSPSSYNKPSKPMHKKAAFSGFEDDELDIDSDEELSVHPKWKSSHVADARHKNRGRGPTGPSRGLTFGSDEEIELDSDVDDDFGSSKRRGNKQGLSRRNHQRSSDRKDVSFSASESENDELSSRGKQYGRNNMEAGERRGNFRGRGDHDFASDPKGRSKGKMGDRRNSWNDDFDRSSRGHGSRDKSRGFQGNDHLGRRNYQRSSDGKDVSFSASESENDGSRGKQYGRNNMEAGGRRGNIRGRGDHDFASDPKGRSKGKLGDRRNSWSDDFDRSSRGHGSRDKSRGFRGNDHSGRRQNNGGGNFRDFKGPKQGRSRDYNMDMDRDFGEFRNSRRVIER